MRNLRPDADAKPQFLNSVISSIGNKDGSLPQPLPILSQPSSELGVNSATNGRNGASATKAAPLPQKRKAEDALPRSYDKVLKGTSYRGSSSMLSSSTTSQQSQTKKPATSSTKPTTQTLLTRGVDKAPASAPAATTTPKLPPLDGSKVPKKGSFADIMARAKASQEGPPPVGIIKHQPKDKKTLSYKKELKLQRKGGVRNRRPQALNGHSRNSSGDVSSGSASRLSSKKGPEIAYKGTAQPTATPKPQPTYKGTMNSGASTAQAGQKKPLPRAENGRQTGPRYQYRDDSEEEESEVEDEGGYSDASDDMEAGFDDVEEEETKATKLARKEDEEEARMEAELKRQKEAKKKRLEELVRKQKAKKPVY